MISILFSWGSGWSHGQNVIYLAQLAFLFTPCNLYFSVDALIFNRGSFLLRAFNNGWGVYLVIVSSCLMWVNAFYFKMVSNPFMSWAFSDSLRNYLLQDHLVIQHHPVPSYLEWIVNYEWA